MSGLIGWLAGAPSAASTAGGYYQNAANELATEYGSPAAQMFSKEYMGAMQPQITQLNQQGLDQLAATGLGGSGAGRATMGDITAQEAGSLAQGVAPMYQTALSQYGNIIGAMPGAQESAYQGAIQDFYDAIQTGAMAYGASTGFPTGGTTSGFGPGESWSWAANPQVASGMDQLAAQMALGPGAAGSAAPATSAPSNMYSGESWVG
jgi:hypothetical protein